MDKGFVAQGIATKLFATENAIDAALIQASTMLSGLLEARQEMNLSATAGDEIVARMSETIAALTTARSAMVGAHAELADLRVRVGVRTRMIGIQDKAEATYEATTGLHVVAS